MANNLSFYYILDANKLNCPNFIDWLRIPRLSWNKRKGLCPLKEETKGCFYLRYKSYDDLSFTMWYMIPYPLWITPNMYEIMKRPMIRKSEGLDQRGDNLVDGDQACQPRLDVLLVLALLNYEMFYFDFIADPIVMFMETSQ